MIPKHITIAAEDDYPLAATLYKKADATKLAIVNSATAVPRRFYDDYARFLAEHGFAVVTYDYRGIGDSRPPGSLRSFSARARDWALWDMSAVLDWATAELADHAYFVGHSYGGQTAGLLANSKKIRAMITVASQSGYWRLQGGNQKAVVAMHMHLTFPIVSHVLGYFPWSKLGSAEDLPKGVALEWAKWCRHDGYLLSDNTLPLERYEQFEAPVLAYSVSDDNWGTEASVNAMMSAYPNLTRRHVHPQDLGLKNLGHFGFFKPKAEALWQDTLTWMRQQ